MAARVLVKWPLSCEHFDENITEACQIRLRCIRTSSQDFRSGVSGGPKATLGGSAKINGCSEINDPGGASTLEHDVGRLEVAMDDPLAMKGS